MIYLILMYLVVTVVSLGILLRFQVERELGGFGTLIAVVLWPIFWLGFLGFCLFDRGTK